MMAKNYSIFLMAAACAALMACGKTEPAAPAGEASAPPSLEQATSAAKAEQDLQKKQSARAEQGNPATPLENYQRIKSGRQIRFAYLAVSPNPLNYEKVAETVSDDYAHERDEFKKRDLLNALKPQIDNEREKARQTKYYLLTASPQLESYNFDGKYFKLRGLSEDGEHYFNDTSQYRIKFSNTNDFSHLKIADEDKARRIEAARTGSGNYRMSLEVYVFAGDTVLGRPIVNAQIMKVRLLDKDGQLLAEQ